MDTATQITSPKHCINPECEKNGFSNKLIKCTFTSVVYLEQQLGIRTSIHTPFLLHPICYTKLYRLCAPTSKPGSKLCHLVFGSIEHNTDFSFQLIAAIS